MIDFIQFYYCLFNTNSNRVAQFIIQGWRLLFFLQKQIKINVHIKNKHRSIKRSPYPISKPNRTPYKSYHSPIKQTFLFLILMQPTLPQPVSSPFRQKIFSLMNQQHPSKILKLSQKIHNHNKTINTSHSPFKEYSMDTGMADEQKLDMSEGAMHFKSLQEKLGLKNLSDGKSQDYDSFKGKYRKGEIIRQDRLDDGKKVSFVQKSDKFYYNPLKNSKHKSKSKTKNSIQKQFSNSNSSLNLKKHANSKPKSTKKNSLNTSLHKSQKNLSINSANKPFSSRHEQLESTQKQTQKKNYLLQTLKKMQSVRKNLTKTFQQFDQQNSSVTERFFQSDGGRREEVGKKKEKEKSKSNLTVISDFVNEEGSESGANYRVNRVMRSKGSDKKNKSSKSKPQESIKKPTKHQSPSSIAIFPNKKTPIKAKHMTSTQSLSQTKQTHPINPTLIKQILHSLKTPQKWQTLLQNDLISIHFRIVKRKLIEIQIHAEKELDHLEVELEKGHLVCQSVKEEYAGVKKREIITLLCSVRGVGWANVGDPSLFLIPKLLLSIETKLRMHEENSTVNFKKEVDLPYTWVMLAEKLDKKQKHNFSSSSKKFTFNDSTSRVKTRSTLQNLPLTSKNQKYPNLIDIFSFCQTSSDPMNQTSTCSSTKKQKLESNHSASNNQVPKKLQPKDLNMSSSKFVYAFSVQENEYKMFVKINHGEKGQNTRSTYDIELEGKGEHMMEKMLLFLEMLG